MSAVAITPRSFREVPGEHWELLRRSGLDPRYPSVDHPLTEEEMVALVEGCWGLIVGIDPVTAAVLDAGPVRVLVKYGSGMDNIDVEAATKRGVSISATPAANARSVAELTLALLLSLARHVVLHDRLVRAGSWGRRMGREVAGLRLAIIGYGAVGREVAALARAVGMDVAVHDPFLDDSEVASADLRTLLSTSDAVTLHVPLNDETRGMIGAGELALMRPGALLVNTARGGLVDERALVDALTSGPLGGAAFDTFEREPPEGSPLLALDNFVASPHAGAATVEATERAGVAAVRELLAASGRQAPDESDADRTDSGR